jgi:hypothetical protein
MNDALYPGYGSPYVQGARRTSPKEVMWRLLRDNPNEKRESLIKLFMEECRGDVELSDVCFEIAAINAYHSWEGLRARGNSAQQKNRMADRRRMAAGIAGKIVKSILDFMMPNNKPLRECTFGEVGRFGRKFQRIAEAGEPNQIVGDVLSPAKAEQLMKQRG